MAQDGDEQGWEQVEGKGSATSNGKPPPEPVQQTTPPPQGPPPQVEPTPEAQTEPPDAQTTVELEPIQPREAPEEEEPSGPTTAEILLQVDKEAFDIPIVFNDEVIEWIEWFMGPGRGTMGRWIERSGSYQRFIQAKHHRAIYLANEHATK